MQAPTRRANGLGERIERAGSIHTGESFGPSTTETVDGEAGIIDFGTKVNLYSSGSAQVFAYTETSRPTHISHAIQITETVDGRSYTHPTVNEDSGWITQSNLLSSVSLNGLCAVPTTVTARTDHQAGSITFRRSRAFSTSTASCSPCPDDGAGPDDVVVQSVGSDPDAQTTSTNCAGGGGPGGETQTYTCYTVTTDYYWYYPDTGEYEYRYSEETTWCESTQ